MASEGILEVRQFEMIVLKFPDVSIIMGSGLIIEGELFYYLLHVK